MGARSGLWGPFGPLGRLAGGVWGVIGDFWVVLGGVAAVFGGFEAVLGRLGADCVRLVGEDEAKMRHAGGMLGACWKDAGGMMERCWSDETVRSRRSRSRHPHSDPRDLTVSFETVRSPRVSSNPLDLGGPKLDPRDLTDLKKP